MTLPATPKLSWDGCYIDPAQKPENARYRKCTQGKNVEENPAYVNGWDFDFLGLALLEALLSHPYLLQWREPSQALRYPRH